MAGMDAHDLVDLHLFIKLALLITADCTLSQVNTSRGQATCQKHRFTPLLADRPALLVNIEITSMASPKSSPKLVKAYYKGNGTSGLWSEKRSFLLARSWDALSAASIESDIENTCYFCDTAIAHGRDGTVYP